MNSSNFQFCVYFTTYSGQLMPPFYIGSSSISKIKNGYCGTVSSKEYKNIWKQELKQNPHLFHTEIVSLHETRQEATDAEELYQREEDVIRNEFYINRAFANKHYGNKGMPRSEEWKERTRQSNLNKKRSEQTRDKNKADMERRKETGWKPWNAGKTGIYSEETLQKMSEKKKGNTINNGRKRSTEFKEKISNDMQRRKEAGWRPAYASMAGKIVRITNGLVNTTIEIEKGIPEGFWRGVTSRNKINNNKEL
jgi:hypothetical protein